MNQLQLITTQDHRAELSEVVEAALTLTRKHGADAASASMSLDQGYEISVRLGELENVKHNNSSSLSVTVYIGEKTGSSTTSDFDEAAIADTVSAACTIAKYTADDPCNGLPPKERLAREFPDLEQFVPWNIGKDEAVHSALSCEEYALSYHNNISNSEGAKLYTSMSEAAFGNTDDFLVHKQSTAHGMQCCVVGSSNKGMQRDYWYDSSVTPEQLEPPKRIGEMAAEKNTSSTKCSANRHM